MQDVSRRKQKAVFRHEEGGAKSSRKTSGRVRHTEASETATADTILKARVARVLLQATLSRQELSVVSRAWSSLVRNHLMGTVAMCRSSLMELEDEATQLRFDLRLTDVPWPHYAGPPRRY